MLQKCHSAAFFSAFQSIDSLEGSSVSRVADQLMLAIKGLEPHKVASMLSELRSDPQMVQRAGLDTEITEILNLLGAQAKTQDSTTDDIDDEEKFLYGDSEDPKPPAAFDPVRQQGLDLYGDVTEENLYVDYPPKKAAIPPIYSLPPGVPPQLQAPPTTGGVEARSVSRPAATLDHNVTEQVSNPVYPPGMEPLEESERQALEEYEKIQDLLKTIGLDLGVTEITKMAARTKERLQGNKPPPKTPTRRRYSSGSSNGSSHSREHRRRSHSSSSSSSRSRSRGRGGSWSSDDDGHRKAPAPPKPHKDVTDAPKQTFPEPSPPPLHPSLPIPTYPPPQVHGMMPPNFPPPGYGQYGNYLPYMHQQWPPMYPPPNMSLPPQTGPDDFHPVLPYAEPHSKVATEPRAPGQCP